MHLILYYVCRAGEDPTLRELAHPNAFSCRPSNDRNVLVLGDILRDFPLRGVGDPVSFAFQTIVGGATRWLHMRRDAPNAAVPLSTSRGNRIFMKCVLPAGCNGLSLIPPPLSSSARPAFFASTSPPTDPTFEDTSFANFDDHNDINNNMETPLGHPADDDVGRAREKKRETKIKRLEPRLSSHSTLKKRHAPASSRGKRGKPQEQNTSSTTTTTSSSSSSRSSRQDSGSPPAAASNGGAQSASARNRRTLQPSSAIASNNRTRASHAYQGDAVGGDGGGGGSFFSILKSAAKTAGQAAKNAASAIRSSVSSAATIGFSSSGITVYIEDTVLAEGGFGTVYRARDGIDHDYTFALKWMIAQERSHIEDAMWEIEVHRRVTGHPNVMELIDHLVRPSERIQSRNAKDILLLYPLCRNGSVFDAISNASSRNGQVDWPFPEPVALRHFLEACAGTNHIHKQGLLHRDIKPHNILLFRGSGGEDDTLTAVLMDLGSAAHLGVRIENRRQALELQDECNSKCSPPYRAPELHEPDPSKVIDGRADVFSLGATLYAMAFGHNPFEHPSRGFEKLALLNGTVSFPESRRNTYGEKYSKGFCSLVKGMLRPEPTRRTKLSRAIKKATELLDLN